MDESLKMRASIRGPTLQTLETQKCLCIFEKFLLHMKIWDLWPLAVGFIRIYNLLSCWESSKKNVVKNSFSTFGKKMQFSEKMSKNNLLTLCFQMKHTTVIKLHGSQSTYSRRHSWIKVMQRSGPATLAAF